MKKILLLLLVSIFSVGAFAFQPDASFQSKKNGKIYFFDFSAKKYLRYNPATNHIEGTFNMSFFCTNWDEKVGDLTPTAVFQSPDGNKVYFLDTRKNKYLRHDWSGSSIDDGWPKALSSFDAGWPSDWKGISNNKVDGAFFNNHFGKLYLFDFKKQKYIKYEWDTDEWTTTQDMSIFGGYASADINLKYSNFASYDSDANKGRFYKHATLSYLEYSWVGNFVGPLAMTKFDNWSDDWTSNVYAGGCTTYYLQGNGGHRLLPLKVDLPQGTYGTDYKIKNLQLTTNTHSNDSIGILLRSPQAGGSVSRELFSFFDASGVNIGNPVSGCPNPVSFNDEGDFLISDGTAPYTGGEGIVPSEEFSGIPAGTVYNGYWYLDIYSESKINSDKFKSFNLEFEPTRSLECNVSETYSAPAGDGIWDMSTVCGTPKGIERVYKFVPIIDGEHFIIEEGGSGYNNYYIKEASLGLDRYDWICPTTTGPEEYSLGDLTAGVVYYIMAKPEMNTGTAATFHVSCPSCEPPFNLSEDGIGYADLDFTWDGPAGVSSYIWQLKQGGILVTNGTAVNTTNLHVDGLQPGLPYTLELKSECGGGLSSNVVSLTISTYDCSSPTNLTANPDVNDITFNWTHGPITHDYSWQISGGGFTNSGTTTSNSVTVSGLAPATSYSFQVKTKCSGSLYSDAASLSNISTLVGVEDLTSLTGLNIYPNPAKDVLNIAIDGIQSSVLDISIVDLLGKVVLENQMRINQGAQHERLDISKLTNGSYFIKITDKGKTASFLFVKE